MSENPIQPMIRDLVFLSSLHPTLGATERRNLGTDVLAPISFLPWWDDAAQCQAFDLIRGLIEILVPFRSIDFPVCASGLNLVERVLKGRELANLCRDAIEEAAEIVEGCVATEATLGRLSPSFGLCGLRLRNVSRCLHQGSWIFFSPDRNIASRMPLQMPRMARGDRMSPDTPSEPGSKPGAAIEMEAEHITTSTRDLEDMTNQLQRWLNETLPAGSNPSITDTTRPESNGMSSETLLFTGHWNEDGVPVERDLVVRIEPPSTAHPVFMTYDLDMQFRVMRLVREHTAAPVPETFWFEPDPAVLGGPFFVMARVEGLVPPDVLPYTFGDNWVFDGSDADRCTLQDSAIRAMAEIHTITPEAHDLVFLEHLAPGATPLEKSLNHWQDFHDSTVSGAPSPLLAECFAWLADNFPTDLSREALSWGDGRIGNMMFNDFEVVAVLDWEMAEVAPPEVDLGWMCYLHLFFQDLAVQLGAPGLPEMLRPADVREAYAKASGRTPGDLTWHIAYAAIRHGLIMRRIAERSISFGEATRPDDIDDLIMHRSTLVGMLDGSYWSGVAL